MFTLQSSFFLLIDIPFRGLQLGLLERIGSPDANFQLLSVGADLTHAGDCRG
jgi:hypothetical protein